MQSKGFTPLIFNIFLPALILSKGGKYLSPVLTVSLGLSLPLAYGAYTAVRKKRFEFLSVLGLLSVSLSGYLTLQNRGGIWFACKEAVMPLIFALYFGFRKQNFIRELIGQPHLLNWSLIQKRMSENPELAGRFDQLFHDYRHRITAAFLLSALCNFILGMWIFTPLPDALSDSEKSALLSQQLGHMTGLGLAMVALPCTLILMWTFFSVLKEIGRLLGVPWKDLLENSAAESGSPKV